MKCFYGTACHNSEITYIALLLCIFLELQSAPSHPHITYAKYFILVIRHRGSTRSASTCRRGDDRLESWPENAS